MGRVICLTSFEVEGPAVSIATMMLLAFASQCQLMVPLTKPTVYPKMNGLLKIHCKQIVSDQKEFSTTFFLQLLVYHKFAIGCHGLRCYLKNLKMIVTKK